MLSGDRFVALVEPQQRVAERRRRAVQEVRREDERDRSRGYLRVELLELRAGRQRQPREIEMQPTVEPRHPRRKPALHIGPGKEAGERRLELRSRVRKTARRKKELRLSLAVPTAEQSALVMEQLEPAGSLGEALLPRRGLQFLQIRVCSRAGSREGGRRHDARLHGNFTRCAQMCLPSDVGGSKGERAPPWWRRHRRRISRIRATARW